MAIREGSGDTNPCNVYKFASELRLDLASGITFSVYGNMTATGTCVLGTTSNSVTLGNNIYVPSLGSSGTYGQDVVYSGGAIVYYASSARYKENIQYDIDYSFLRKLKPVIYNPIGSNQKHYGLIAEDVVQVEPCLVPLDKDGRPEAVRYTLLISPLIKFVCDLDKKIDTIEEAMKEISTLRERVNILEASI
jgi:hypothetical protein